MNKIAPFIGWILLIIVFSVYLFGIYSAVKLINIHSGKLLEPLDTLTSSVDAMLLLNLGAVLGISVSKPGSGLAQILLINKPINEISEPIKKREVIQIFSVLIYLIVLVTCFITWAFNCFSDDNEKVSILVMQNGKVLIAVITAYLAFVLGIKG